MTHAAVLRGLCEAGLPEGNVYEFAALRVLKFEKKFKADKKKKDLELRYGHQKKKYEKSGRPGSPDNEDDGPEKSPSPTRATGKGKIVLSKLLPPPLQNLKSK